MSERDSLHEALRALPRAWKFIAAAFVALVSVATTVGTVAVTYQGMATDDEVAAEIKKHNARGRDADDSEKSPHPPYARAIKLLEERTFSLEQERNRQRKRDTAVFEHLVSLQAADVEPDRRRKAEAAAHARNVYRDALHDGLEPEEAAKKAIDDHPPWRRR